MTKIMTASQMTDGQIENAVNKLRDAMRKDRSEITSEVAQRVLGVENLGMIMFTPFRERAEAISNLIVHPVTVNRRREPMDAIKATGRNFYGNEAVVKAMPRGDGDKVEVIFFKPNLSERGGLISDDDLDDRGYELRGLKPADPYSLAAVNEADPAFADEHPNTTHWKDDQGQWCYAAFSRYRAERRVNVCRLSHEWIDAWCFAGLRK